jgi:integrase
LIQKVVRKIGTSTSGIIKIEDADGRLRLRWTYPKGKRHCLALGLPDSKINRTVAMAKANAIELDIISGNFSSVEHYKPQSVENSTQISLAKAFERFWLDKEKDVCDRTYENYRAAIKWLHRFLKNEHVKIKSITLEVADGFTEWLQQQALSDVTLKTYLTLLKAVWDWAKSQELVESNPWPRMVKRIRVNSNKEPKPFTAAERDAIIQGFRTSRYYGYLADYVEFLLSTGVRVGEANGLLWKHLSDDCKVLKVSESLSNGVRKQTKNRKVRGMILTSRLTEMLLARRPEPFNLEEPVFTTPLGKPIDPRNFRNRAWVKVVDWG